jgi:hypothetical protein
MSSEKRTSEENSSHSAHVSESWKADEESFSMAAVDRRRILIRDAGGLAVGEAYLRSTGERIGYSELMDMLKNAQLLAAGPELLLACKRALREIQAEEGTSVGLEEDLKAAIEKAEPDYDDLDLWALTGH